LDPIVSTGWLAEHASDPALRVFDVRWYLDPKKQGREQYLAGHIPGAAFLDLDLDLAAPGGARGGPLGRHPWPPAAKVAEVMGRAGVGDGVTVVAYDDQAGAIAARLWFLLRVHGHADVAVLDGGILKWKAEGRALESEPSHAAPATFHSRFDAARVLSKAEVAGLSRVGGALILDARAPERYRGDKEPIDPRAGHVPGARNAPFTDNLSGGELPVFLPKQELRRRYAALGAEAREPIVYCGSGVTACHDLLALELAGLRGRLYAGSWSEWSSDVSLPVETG
jgi:thiosulfate/3-mercaptopyruvate sulfurtransferase